MSEYIVRLQVLNEILTRENSYLKEELITARQHLQGHGPKVMEGGADYDATNEDSLCERLKHTASPESQLEAERRTR
jgi:hypothetical protein